MFLGQIDRINSGNRLSDICIPDFSQGFLELADFTLVAPHF